MTLTQLRAFLAVAETGSVRGAAQRLLVSQPSVSAAVAALERELGIALVERHGRGLRLTPAGVVFAAEVRTGLGTLDAAARVARSIEDPEHGTVRIAAVTTAVEHVLLAGLAAFRRAHPHAGLVVHAGNRSAVWEALRSRTVDLVVAGRPPAVLRARILARAPNRLVLIGPASEADGELSATTWLLREEGSGTREATETLLNRLGIDPPRMVLGSNSAIARAVAAGLGVALISEDAVGEILAAGAVRCLRCPGTPVERPWHLVAYAGAPLGPPAAALVDALVQAGFTPTSEGRRLLRD